MVARRFLLLVGMLVFLIDNNEAERVHRRKNRRARPNDDARAALTDFMPLIVPLAGGQMAVQNRNERLQRAGAEATLEPFDGLRRERDFRHEHDGAFSLLQAMGDGLQINFGLAAARDAVEEEGARVASIRPGGTRVPRVVFGVPPNTQGARLRPWRPNERIIFRRANQPDDSRVVPHIIPLLAQVGFGTDPTIE